MIEKYQEGINVLVGTCKVCGKEFHEVNHVDCPIEGYECICSCGNIQYIDENCCELCFENIDISEELMNILQKDIVFYSDNHIDDFQNKHDDIELFLKENGRYLGSMILDDNHTFYEYQNNIYASRTDYWSNDKYLYIVKEKSSL